MTTEEIARLKSDLEAAGEKEVQLLETHISWVLLGDMLAWKIKKPVKYDFADFTSLEIRHELCRRELYLNQRLAPDVYLAVAPVTRNTSGFSIGLTDGEVADYAVVMKKLDNDLLLSRQLLLGNVTDAFMQKLAAKVADFHHAGAPVAVEWDGQRQLDNFSDILSVEEWLESVAKIRERGEVRSWIRLAGEVHQLCEWRFRQRVDDGFFRDGHGDLHAGNIFYYEDDPVIFDCIEFNDDFRNIDVLYEIAFLCMDLDNYDHFALRKAFLEYYQARFPAVICREDVLIFKYYCFMRASIRLKVTALKAMDGDPDQELMQQTASYAALTGRYAGQLRNLIDRYAVFEKEVFLVQDAFE